MTIPTDLLFEELIDIVAMLAWMGVTIAAAYGTVFLFKKLSATWNCYRNAHAFRHESDGIFRCDHCLKILQGQTWDRP